MKKWLITLSIIVVLGTISSATLAGHVYYNELKTYEDYDKKDLSLENLKSIYIKSDAPIEIHPTKGKPYVEFTQSYTDIVGIAPKYELEVQEKEDTTYIDLEQVKGMSISIGVKENKANLVVYLPEKDIEKLVVDEYSYSYYYRNKKIVDLQNINVKELNLNVLNSEIKLNGSYNKVEIDAHSTTLNMESKVPSEVKLSGVTKQDLNGQFERIVVCDNSYEVNINSANESIVELNCNNSNVRLEGKYEEINIDGQDNRIDVRSETVCKLSTKGYDNTINADGAFETINMQEEQGKIEVKTTMLPKSIQMIGHTFSSIFSLTLPSNISGYTLRCTLARDDYYDDQDTYEINQRIEEGCHFRSEFENIEKEVKDNGIEYKYGDGKIPITLNVAQNTELNIIDGGYSSAVTGKN